MKHKIEVEKQKNADAINELMRTEEGFKNGVADEDMEDIMSDIEDEDDELLDE